MKICLMNNLYPYQRGGAERVVERYFAELCGRGHSVFVIAANSFTKKKSIDNIYYIKSSFVRLGEMPLFLRFFWHFWDFINFVSVWRIFLIFKKERPDLVITHNIKGLGFLSFLLFRLFKIRHFHILHDIQLLHPSGLLFWGEERVINSWFAKVYQRISLFFLRKTEVVVSPSAWLMSLHEEKKFFTSARKIISPNPFSLPGVSIKKKDGDDFTFLFVGQIERHKGVHLLLEAFNDSLSSQSVLRLVGDGADRDIFSGFSSPRCQFLGKKDKGGVLCEMLNADCLIIPSLCYENSPTVIYEAAALGLPVLGASFAGIKELLDYLGGVFFSPGDYNDLREKMAWCLANRGELKKIGAESAVRLRNKNFETMKWFDEVVDLH